jgi:hypothetical protein
MKNIRLRLLSTLASAAAAMLLMGASGQVVTNVTSSTTGSITSKTTTSVVSKTTGSIATKMTGSIASGITSSVTTSATTSVISRGSGSRPALSPSSEELAKIIKFDRQVLVIVKGETQEHIQRLIGYDENDYQIIAPGIAVSVPKDKTDRVLASLRKKLVPLKYLPFVVEMNAGLKADTIGVIKGTDPYEILRIMHTDGDDYDISNQDVIDRLKEWEKCCPFDILGAGSDWVEIEFKTPPKDLKAFVEEVNDFSPDAVEQGPGTIGGMIKEIIRTNRLFLLWE